MKKKLLYLGVFFLLLTSCKQRFNPKPNGYIRIDFENKIDSLFNVKECGFSFRTANYFILKSKNTCWLDLKYPKHNATIHLTYKRINNNLFQLLEESRNMVYKHTIKADAINEKIYLNKNRKIYGTLYDITGASASSIQFHVTDSINNFIRGALYLYADPNPDSLRPVINYLREDIVKIMETLNWEY